MANYGIVTEFNPFHNGHKYLIDYLKQDGSSTVTAVMSGNFVQRGEPALLNANLRAKTALECGVDLVLQLPSPYSVSTAEKFAFSAVSVLNSLNILDFLAFGSETAEKMLLNDCADVILNGLYDATIKKYLKSGVSYPKARENAVFEIAGEKIGNVLKSPNDILGVEYVKALKKLDSKMDFLPVKRVGAEHDSAIGENNIRSASFIRSSKADLNSIKDFMPLKSFEVLKNAVNNGKFTDYEKFGDMLLARLRMFEKYEFLNIPDVTEGLEFRIYDAIRTSTSYSEVLEKIKTKRYTLSRIRRILLNSYLGVTSKVLETPVPYIKVLGFNQNGAELLKKAKGIATLPIITRSADIKNLNEKARKIFEFECKARDSFSWFLTSPDVCGMEQTERIIIKK